MIDIGQTKPTVSQDTAGENHRSAGENHRSADTDHRSVDMPDRDTTAELLREAERRATRLQTAAEISRAATSQLNLEDLLPESVELIRSRFGLYYVGLFLLDDRAGPHHRSDGQDGLEQWAVLRAGTGEAGQKMLAAQHRLRLGGHSMIGQCVATGEARIALNVAEVGTRFENPVLPKTQSEMALPLISRSRVLGAMTIQSERQAAFSDEDITVLQTMADQLATAIQNALLFEGMNRAVRENELLYNISSRIGAAQTVDDLVSASLSVASYLTMDTVSLAIFTRWDADGEPVAADIYEASNRSEDNAGTHHRSAGTHHRSAGTHHRSAGRDHGAAGVDHRSPAGASDVPFDRAKYTWYARRSRKDPGRIVFVPDCQDMTEAIPDAFRAAMAKRGQRSLIAAPLPVRDRIRAMLELVGPTPLADASGRAPVDTTGTPSEGRVQVFVRTLVDQVASALDRHFLMDELSHRAASLQRASEISRITSSYLDPQQLLDEGAELVLDRFELASVDIYLVDDSGQWAILRSRAGRGSAASGQRELSHRVAIDETSPIGRCIGDREVVTEERMQGGPGSAQSDDASPSGHTIGLGRYETVFPLISQNQVIGAISVREGTVHRFAEDDVAIFSTLSGQLANAIANAQLYEMSQSSLLELQRLQQRYAMDMWDDYLERQDVLGYAYDLTEITPLMVPNGADDGRVHGFDAAATHDRVPVSVVLDRDGMPVDGTAGSALVQPLTVRGEPVGFMSFADSDAADKHRRSADTDHRSTIWSEDQASVLEAVREQLELALENRLLIDRSQRALREARQREAELGFLQDVSAFLNATNDVVASRAELFAQLQSFLPLRLLTLTGYDSESGRLTWLAAEVDEVGTPHRFAGTAHSLEDSGFDWVIANQSPVVVDDLHAQSRFPEDERLLAAGLVSRVVLPLRLGYRTMGAIELASDEAGAFARPGLMPILQQVASQVASAMERGNLLRVAQSSAEESRRLYEVTSDLAEAADAVDILEAIARHAFPSNGARAEVGLFVVDPETGQEQEWLEIVAVHNLSRRRGPATEDALHLGARVRVSELPSLDLLGQEQMAMVADIARDPNLRPEVREFYLSQGVRALVVLSLSTGPVHITGGSTYDRIGVLQVRFANPVRMTEEDVRLYRTVSEQAAVVLSNRQLFQESQSRIMRQAVAVELANLTTSLSEREALLQAAVEFLRDRFELYFAGIFLTDDLGQWAVLQAGSGDVGERLMLMGHRVQVGGNTIVGRCIRQRARILTLDIGRAEAVLENPLLPDTRSAVAFPLISRGQTNGVITLQSTHRFAFTQEDLSTLELMVNQLANVIESTNLYERSQASLAETRMLYRIAQQITDAREADAVLRAAVEGISQRTEPDWVIAGLLEPREDPTTLRIVVSWSRDGVSFPRESFELGSIRQFYDVLRSDERFVTPNITQDPMADDLVRRIYTDLGLRATAAFQLSVRSQQYGTIMVHSQNAREFSTAELSFYENVARQAFVALENISLVEATREQAERRDILNEVLQTASSSLNRTRILQDVSAVIARRLAMPVLVWEWDGVSAAPVAVHAAGGSVLALPEDAFQLKGQAMERIHAALLNREPVDVRFGSNTGLTGLRHDLESALVDGYAVPLTARDVVYGVIVLARQMGHDGIDQLQREFMQTAGTNVAVALETASLYLDAQETAEKLKEVDELKNQFMANMSHELRTPLNSIIGFSRVMLKGIDGPLTDMQETDLGAIYDSGRHLLNLINDILDISKINAGKMEVIYEPVGLKAMIQSVMSTAMGFVKDKPVKLLTDVPDDLPTVVADSRRIRQVLTNLLGNAGKFTDEGFIKVSASSDDYQVIVSVQDTGIGIPPDRIHAVFEQFEQVDSSSSRRYQGTGLGVPLSREFVRMHGGDMWIHDSVVGEGTTFCFSLPIGGPDSVEESRSPVDPAHGRVVLTVDDDEGVITLFRRYLERNGYKVFGLTRGDRVIEEAIRLKPYAITLDVLMPGRDGWQVIQELKANPETRDIPVIICSVLGDQGRGISMGITDYLIKPISEEALLNTLAHLSDQLLDGHVLVVDDNPDDRKLLRRILESAEYHVLEAAGGTEAIEQIGVRPPSLVVLDLMMPEVDGFAVLEQLKRDQATRGIPVVVVTAKELTRDERARLQQRVEALLEKGLFDQQQLLNDVTTALRRLRT